jgi:hypothetical protein
LFWNELKDSLKNPSPHAGLFYFAVIVVLIAKPIIVGVALSMGFFFMPFGLIGAGKNVWGLIETSYEHFFIKRNKYYFVAIKRDLFVIGDLMAVAFTIAFVGVFLLSVASLIFPSCGSGEWDEPYVDGF